LSLTLASCASSAQLSAAAGFAPRAAPVATATPGEHARPIALEEGSALDAAGGATKPRSDVSIPAVTSGRVPDPANVGVSRGTAYLLQGDRVRAIDLASGATRWTSAPGFGANGAPAVADRLVIVLTANSNDTVALRTRDGGRAYTLRGVSASGIVDGILYARHGRNFAAYDVSDGKRLWETPGGGGGLFGKPAVIGTTLLQLFFDSGAITVGDLYGFDVRTGHAHWVRRSNVEPLGVQGRNLYVDSTWFPSQLDNYVPLTVSRIDTASGDVLDTYTYTPDPDRHAHPPSVEGPGRATASHVTGGFVYLLVRGSWYRYAADTDPARADATRLDGIDDILAWFGNGTLLVIAHDELAVARDTGGRIVLQRIAAVRGYSKAFARGDGTQYVVDADTLFAVAPDATAVRRLGAVPCGGEVAEIVAADNDVAVVCSGRTGSDRIVAFTDPLAPVRAPASQARPQAAPPARFLSRVRIFSIPPRPDRSSHQWWLHAITPLPDGGVAFTLDPGTSDAVFAIGRANAQGRIDVTMLGTSDHVIVPDDVVADRHGKVWFNDAGAPAVASLDRSGRIAWHVPGEARELPAAISSVAPSPAGMRGGPPRARPRGLGVRLAIGPDGEAWFARTHPARIIARVDGSASFRTPDDLGDIFRLRGDPRGFWYTARSGAGQVTPDGRFSRLPLAPMSPAGYHQRILAPGANRTVWLAAGPNVVHANDHAILLRTTLPNATVGATAAVAGCDGALYVAETVPQIARITPNGQIDEFPIDVFGIDGITVGSDCRLWFAAGSNAPKQQVGTLELRPRRASARHDQSAERSRQR
jgi:streptogramin lyase